MLTALATSYPTWMVVLARLIVVSPVVPGIVMMIVAAIRGPGLKSSRLMIAGTVMLVAGAALSLFLYHHFG